MTGIPVDTPFTHPLVAFYRGLLGLMVRHKEPDRVRLRAPRARLPFVPDRAGVRDAGRDPARMLLHLDVLSTGGSLRAAAADREVGDRIRRTGQEAAWGAGQSRTVMHGGMPP
ncbi:hypothetical protein GCM10023080_014540 [Streptomyces pseudoechinosporeus]